jgi:hypothetical protein
LQEERDNELSGNLSLKVGEVEVLQRSYHSSNSANDINSGETSNEILYMLLQRIVSEQSHSSLLQTQAMDRGRKAMPVQNKACMDRYVQRCQERHEQKVCPLNTAGRVVAVMP